MAASLGRGISVGRAHATPGASLLLGVNLRETSAQQTHRRRVQGRGTPNSQQTEASQDLRQEKDKLWSRRMMVNFTRQLD